MNRSRPKRKLNPGFAKAHARQVAGNGSGNARTLDSALRKARETGSLKLHGRGLEAVPNAVYRIGENLEGDEKWWEQVGSRLGRCLCPSRPTRSLGLSDHDSRDPSLSAERGGQV